MPKVTYQYRSPTCLLDVVGTPSRLSQWTDRPVLKGARFQIRFLAEGDGGEITIRGDRAQLDTLCLAVDHYMQQILMDDRWLAIPVLATQGRCEQSAGLEPVPNTVDKSASDIYLRPVGLLNHDLVLGSLGTKVKPTAQPTLRLSMSQLADLVTVLDHYNAEVLALPSLSAGRSFPISATQWRAIAATLVLSVGTIGVLARIASSPLSTSISASKSVSMSSELSSHLYNKVPTGLADQAKAQGDRPQLSLEQQSVAPAPSPRPPTAATLSKPSPGDSSLDRRLRQQQTSPAPVPQVALSPPLSSGTNDDFLSSAASINQPEFNSPELQRSITSNTLPTAQMPAPTSARMMPPGQREVNQRSASSSNSDSTRRDAPSPASSPSVLDTMAPVPPPAAMPAPAVVPPSTSIGQTARSSGTTSGVEPQPTLSEVDQGQAVPPAPSLPQLAELKRYVERNWQPPSSLTEPLRYRLLLNADGSVQSVKPVGPTAWRYRSTLQFPGSDQPLVSPTANRRPLWLWLELKPSGQVLVYEERSE
ncbi:MAG: DUF4335 domain-containing protein [Cyanobacteria bacterium]|nr:DUF4335 domain-containing protein [Cyanobacteriota bacterium]MDW8201521.1 DUF4335 domain-containing protein [Cyanobacteriota bacterium SKYGB_h_bin112]